MSLTSLEKKTKLRKCLYKQICPNSSGSFNRKTWERFIDFICTFEDQYFDWSTICSREPYFNAPNVKAMLGILTKHGVLSQQGGGAIAQYYFRDNVTPIIKAHNVKKNKTSVIGFTDVDKVMDLALKILQENNILQQDGADGEIINVELRLTYSPYNVEYLEDIRHKQGRAAVSKFSYDFKK